MSILLKNEREVPALECMVRLFNQTPELQLCWRNAADKYGEQVFPNLHDLASKYFSDSKELESKWEFYQGKYGKKFYPDLKKL